MTRLLLDDHSKPHCEHDDYTMVKLLLDRNTLYEKYDYCMNVASANNNLSIVKLLLDYGINCGDALRNAASNDNFEMVKILAETCIDQKAFDRGLIGACKAGNCDIIKYLIMCGANIHAKNNESIANAAGNGKTECSNEQSTECASRCHLSAVKILIENGADPNIGFVCAAEAGHLDIVCYLFSCGASVTYSNNYALIMSAKNGHLNVVDFLIKNGAGSEPNSYMALVNAINGGYLSVVKYLFNYFDNDCYLKNPETDFRKLCKAACVQADCVDSFKMFMTTESDLSECNFFLMMAIDEMSTSIIKYILGLDSDINKNKGRELRYAVKTNNSYIVEILVNAGMTTDIKIGKKNLLQYAKSKKYYKIYNF